LLDTSTIKTATLVVCPLLREEANPALVEEEAVGLCHALNLDVIDVQSIVIRKISAATYFSKGHLENFKQIIDEKEIDLLYVDAHIKPGQQRDLEKFLNIKVVDRTGLILEIFAERASTQEGRIQVDLAYKKYQKSRLVRAWTHLERQRGGASTVGGPGEKQTELDRRALDVEIKRLEKDLEKIKSNRSLQRKAREKESFPIIALVGYTNAGKSTLFNILTHSKVLSKDMLFATLDPTMRAMELPNGQKTIMSDTVGFIRNLPTELVAAFSATLEEVVEADIILHVHDISADDHMSQGLTVKNTLEDLGIDYGSDHIIHVYNKIDLLTIMDEIEASRLEKLSRKDASSAVVSARTGRGLNDLLSTLVYHLALGQNTYEFHINSSDGKALAWLHANATVNDIAYDEKIATINVTLGDAALNKFTKVFNYNPLL